MKLRKRWVIPVGVVIVLAGLAEWHWYRSRTPTYKARQLVAELRDEPPTNFERLLIKYGLARPREARDAFDVREDLAALGAPAVPVLIRALEKEGDDVRRHVLVALDRMGPAALQAVPALIRLLDDGKASLKVRETAAMVLGSIGPAAEHAVPALLRGLQSKHAQLPNFCAGALGEMGPAGARAVPPLVEMARKGQPGALLALEAMGPQVPGVIPALIEILNCRTDPPEFELGIRSASARVLARLGPTAGHAIPALTKALESEEGELRVAAAAALIRIDRARSFKLARRVLLGSLSDKNLSVSFDAAAILTDAEAGLVAEAVMSVLVQGLRDNDDWVHASAMRRLIMIGPRAAAHVVDVLKDEKYPARLRAVEVLSEIGPLPQEAITSLVELLARPDEFCRARAASALGKIGPPARQAAEKLRDLAADDDEPAVRRAAAKALKKIMGKAATQPAGGGR